MSDQISGIYKITAPNGKIYIGQSLQIHKRWNRHKRSINENKNTKLINSFYTFGVNNHTFEIIEICEVEKLRDSETKWIEYYNSFNTPNGLNGNAGRGCGIPSMQTRKKNSESQKIKYAKGEYNRNGKNNGMYGNGYKLKGEKNGRYGKDVSLETRKKISEGNKKYWQRIRESGLEGKVIHSRKYNHRLVIELHNKGLSNAEIKNKLGIKYHTIYYIVTKSITSIINKNAL